MVLLELKNVSKHFGSFSAVSNVSFQINKDKLYSIIGPNGAGKTTIFNLITGHLGISSGEIEFDCKTITGLKTYQISTAGIARSFQLNNIFPALTVLENLRLAVQSRYSAKFNIYRHVCKFRTIEDKAKEILNKVGLEAYAKSEAQYLSHGDKRLLEIGIALGTDPILLLMDEPTSGMALEETSYMIDFIKEISKELTIVLIEHRMNLVMNISDEIIVLNQGRLIAQGSPDKIQNDPQVKIAYLGVCE